MKQPVLFFRNDDVRNSLDDSLIKITDIFIKHNIPITHAVEPANVTEHVISWLLEKKKIHPEIIEIIQHGYDHKPRALTVKGEFGGSRTYDDQLKDIINGKKMMDRYFGSHWFPAFTFPYGSYNYDTLLALKDAGFKFISTGFTYSFKRMIFNTAGITLRKKFLLSKKINYFNKKIPGLDIMELPVSINLTKTTINENNSIQKSFEELKNQFEIQKNKYNTIGFLMHHRWWGNDDFNTLDNFLTYLKINKHQFSTMENLND